MPDRTPSSTPDPAEQIVSALATLRGRRMPRPPWDDKGAGGEGPWGRRGMRFPDGRGGANTSGGSEHDGHTHNGFPHGPQGMRGMPPWAAGMPPRFGGPARMRLLEALAAASHPLSISEIGDAVGVDQPRASRLVQQSVELGLVRREADPDDARRSRVVLTDDGKALIRGFRGERRGAVESALGDFSEAERVELARLLTKLAKAWPQS
nr:MarR family winged helix-turn-helix transcriptional regulator [Microbacterium lemovicicum]